MFPKIVRRTQNEDIDWNAHLKVKPTAKKKADKKVPKTHASGFQG